MKTQIIMMAAVAAPIAIFAQQKTYFDADWQVTTQDKMEYYRETTKEGNLYHIKDYYKSGKIQMDGFSKNNEPNKEIFEGKVTWYNEDGSVQKYTHYKNGIFDGEEYWKRADGSFSKSMYKNGEVVSSERLSLSHGIGQSNYQKFDGKTTTNVFFDEDINGIRWEESYSADENNSTKYYGEGGKYLGERTIDEKGNTTGVLVDYDMNPMRVSRIHEYKNGIVVSIKEFYNNGKLQSEFKQRDKTGKEVFYDNSGKIIGLLDYKNTSEEDESVQPYNGVQINFDEDIFSHKEYYQNGKNYKTDYFKNGILWQVKENEMKTEADFNLPAKMTTYNPDGSVKFVLNYKDGQEYNGTFINDELQRDYKDGKITYEKSWYEDGKIHYTKTLVGENTYNGSTFFKNGEKYNDFTILDSESGYFSGTITPYKNGKKTETLTFKEGILDKGKLKFFSGSSSEPVEIENDGKNYFFREFEEGEIMRETRTPIKFLGSVTPLMREEDVFRNESESAVIIESLNAAAVSR